MTSSNKVRTPPPYRPTSGLTSHHLPILHNLSAPRMRNHAKEITARCLITDINTTLFSAHLGMPPRALAFSGRPSLISHLGMPPSASAFSGRPSLFIFPSQYSLEISHALYLLGVMHTRMVSELSPPAKTCKIAHNLIGQSFAPG